MSPDDYLDEIEGADDDLEPPVPPGLATLSAAQSALAEFLRLDDDLLAVAAESSRPLRETSHDADELRSWVKALDPVEKDQLLTRVLQDDATVRMELLRRFRGHPGTATHEASRRAVVELLQARQTRRDERTRRTAAERAQAEARRAQERARARQQRLEDLARDEDGAWERVNALIDTKKPAEYGTAVAVLQDLRALADRDGRTDEFASRSAVLRQHHARKRGLIQRLDQAAIGTDDHG